MTCQSKSTNASSPKKHSVASFETGLHRTYIGVLERGEKNVSLRNLVLVARKLGISASQLLAEAGL
jgi:transcriptional regulator with XRE-family HTH domain